jgi:D-ribose pyranose/furanose isomerase RbsD
MEYTIRENPVFANFFEILLENHQVKQVRFNSNFNDNKTSLIQDVKYFESKRSKKPKIRTEVLDIFECEFKTIEDYRTALKTWLDNNLDKLQ